jgi:RNA polymerase sigma-70 factor (ECF subfamily)
MVRKRHTDEARSAARHGDSAALRAVYERLAPAVFGYLTARGVPDPEAVTSDIFVAVFKRLDAIEGVTAGLRTAVFSDAYARIPDEVRPAADDPALVAYRPGTDFRTSAAAARVALREIDSAGVVAMVNRLAPGQRDVLLLRVVADLSIDQVAEITQRSRVAVKQLQRRGFVALRTMLVLEAQRAAED